MALLKVPDVELDPDLLRRTWQAPDWNDHASVLRRILPQFTTALINGHVTADAPAEDIGRSFARGRWQQWATEQSVAVREFLNAWLVHTLTDSDPAAPTYEVLPVLAEASGSLAELVAWLAPRSPARGEPPVGQPAPRSPETSQNP